MQTVVLLMALGTLANFSQPQDTFFESNGFDRSDTFGDDVSRWRAKKKKFQQQLEKIQRRMDAHKQDLHDFQPPLDIVDGAARICDPFFNGILTGKHWCGKFLKDYAPIDW